MYTNRMARRAASKSERRHGKFLGRLIGQERRQREWSASDLSRRSGVSVDAIRSLESGRVPTPSFLTIARLAESLGLDLDDLQARASGRDPIQEVHVDDVNTSV